MAIDVFQTLNIIETMENFIAHRRPPIEIRDRLDLSYKIIDQSVIIHEIRPRFDNPEIKMEPAIAKTTFIKSNNTWKVFSIHADLKWHIYPPKPIVKSLKEFLKLVEEDSHGCFWG